jgi:hypothetical protein
MCGTIDPGMKTGYDRSATRAVSTVGTLA